MCELLAITANEAVRVAFSWAAFNHRGHWNRDGWGFQFALNGHLETRRFATDLPTHSGAADLVKPVRARLFLAHVRHAVQGTVRLENTQPFVDGDAELGMVASMSSCRVTERFRASVRHAVSGQTGTEILFHVVLRALDGSCDETRLLEALRDVFNQAELPPNASASLVLTDGRSLYAFRQRKRMYWLTRRPPHTAVVHLLDPAHLDYQVDLGEEKGPHEVATILASVPLTDEGWHMVPERTLLVLSDGEQRAQHPL